MTEPRFQSLGVLEALRDFHLPEVPYLQILLARIGLGLDYRIPRSTTISVEGLEYLDSDEPMMVAMNHTDRFNYMPFMKELDRVGLPPLAPWVKGKYYRKVWLGTFLTWCACMPIPSRGFLLSLDWLARLGEPPDSTEYRQLRHLGDGCADEETLTPRVLEYLRKAPGGATDSFFSLFQGHFEGLSREVVRINEEAMTLGYRPLVFPQGTRSRALTRGFSGIVQMALHTGVRILPIGVSGSDLLYPGDSPFSKGGHVHYAVGEPFNPAEGIEVPAFKPLTIEAFRHNGELFDSLMEQLMERINNLLPADYGFQESGQEAAGEGAERFL